MYKGSTFWENTPQGQDCRQQVSNKFSQDMKVGAVGGGISGALYTPGGPVEKAIGIGLGVTGGALVGAGTSLYQINTKPPEACLKPIDANGFKP